MKNKQSINSLCLPDSLLLQRRNKNKKRVLTLLILLTFVTLSAVLFMDDLFPETVIFRNDSRYTYAKIAFFSIFYLLCFVISGVPFKMLGRSFSGTVTKVDVTDDYGFTKVVVRTGIGRIYRQNNIVLTIECDDGEIVTHTALSLYSPDEDHVYSCEFVPYNYGEIDMHIDDYHVGDRVYKYRGYEHVCIENAQGERTCVVCGHFNGAENDCCWNCDSELPKHKS